MIAVALSHRKSYFDGSGLPHACRTCKAIPERKLQWGCKEPTKDPQLWIPCLGCGGEDPGCPDCQGTGYEAIYRCPRSLVGRLENEYRTLHRHWPAALPVAGGIWDQPAIYIAAMRLLDFAEDKMQMLIREEQEMKSQRGGMNG